MKLNKQDLDRVISLLPTPVESTLILEGKRVVWAGGFIRDPILRVSAKDIDLFATSPELAKKIMNDLNFLRKEQLIVTKNAYSIKNIEGRFVQAIHRWSYPTPEALLKSFDFTVSCAAIWYDETTCGWESLVDDNFYTDLAAKRLTFRFPERQEDCAGSLIRVLRFVKKGYTISSESLAGVIARIVKEAKPDKFEYAPDCSPYHEPDIEQQWVKYIHRSIASVTGES